jgi:hypothetical protein
MSEQTAVVAPVAESTPATIPIGSLNDVASYREARDKGLNEVPNPAAPAKVETPVPTPKEPTADQAQVEADSSKPDAELSEAGRKLRAHRSDARKQKIQQEINDAIRERETLRREIEALRTQRTPSPTPEGGKPGPTQEAPAPSAFPTYEAWLEKNPNGTYEDYTDARTDFRFEQRQQAESAARQRDEASRTERELIEGYATKAQDARTRYADFDAVVGQDLPISEVMSQAMFRSDVGADLAYALGKDPDLCKRIAALPPAAALIAMGKLEATIEARSAGKPTTPPVTAAPAPVPVVGGTGSVQGSRDPKDINSVAEWNKRRDEFLTRR